MWDTAAFNTRMRAITGTTSAEVGVAVRNTVTQWQRDAQASMTQSHSRGTPTSSSPGSPPAVISGTLRRSITSSTVSRVGTAWMATVSASSVYARVQELGGATGRNHATILPPRPYFGPQRAHAQQRLAAELRAAWVRTIRA